MQNNYKKNRLKCISKIQVGDKLVIYFNELNHNTYAPTDNTKTVDVIFADTDKAGCKLVGVETNDSYGGFVGIERARSELYNANKDFNYKYISAFYVHAPWVIHKIIKKGTNDYKEV